MTGWEKIVEALKLGRAYAEASVHHTKDLKLMDEALSGARARQATSRMVRKRRAPKPLNHDLLERSRDELAEKLESLIDNFSVGTIHPGRSEGELVRIPDLSTLMPQFVDGAEKLLQLIREIESEIGRPYDEAAPQWLRDLIDGRTSLPEKAGA